MSDDTTNVPVTEPTTPTAAAPAPQHATAPVAPNPQRTGVYVPRWLFATVIAVAGLLVMFAGLHLALGIARRVAFGGLRRSHVAAAPAFQRRGGFRGGRGYVPSAPSSDGGFRR